MKKRLSMIACLVLLVVSFSACITVEAAEGYERVAEGSGFHAVMREGMEPVSADMVADGSYEIAVSSSSQYFRIAKAVLHVVDGQMSAELTITGTSYECLYMGTGEQAAKASKEEYLFLEKNGSDSVVTIPVQGLSRILPCASFSKGRHRWYDRNLVLDASSLPAEAVKAELPAYGELMDLKEEQKKAKASDSGSASGSETQNSADGTISTETSSAAESDPAVSDGTQSADSDTPEPVAAKVNQKDGDYSIEVMLTGGSGRASVSSPAWLYVKNGRAYAKLLWSSVYYDYLILDGKTYYNETTDGGNSSFTIPITAFDQKIDIIADTTAMGDPVEIEYALTFYEDTIGNKGQVPQEAAKRVLGIAAAIIILGGLLNWIVKKKMGRY